MYVHCALEVHSTQGNTRQGTRATLGACFISWPLRCSRFRLVEEAVAETFLIEIKAASVAVFETPDAAAATACVAKSGPLSTRICVSSCDPYTDSVHRQLRRFWSLFCAMRRRCVFRIHVHRDVTPEYCACHIRWQDRLPLESRNASHLFVLM